MKACCRYTAELSHCSCAPGGTAPPRTALPKASFGVTISSTTSPAHLQTEHGEALFADSQCCGSSCADHKLLIPGANFVSMQPVAPICTFPSIDEGWQCFIHASFHAHASSSSQLLQGGMGHLLSDWCFGCAWMRHQHGAGLETPAATSHGQKRASNTSDGTDHVPRAEGLGVRVTNATCRKDGDELLDLRAGCIRQPWVL